MSDFTPSQSMYSCKIIVPAKYVYIDGGVLAAYLCPAALQFWHREFFSEGITSETAFTFRRKV
eukprot:scaffold17048_cov17-Prasinocladus_malaysianus.AAC.1